MSSSGNTKAADAITCCTISAGEDLLQLQKEKPTSVIKCHYIKSICTLCVAHYCMSECITGGTIQQDDPKVHYGSRSVVALTLLKTFTPSHSAHPHLSHLSAGGAEQKTP